MKWLLYAILPFLFVVVLSPSVKAIPSDEIFVMTLVNNFEFCYNNALTSSLTARQYSTSNFNSLMNDGYKQSGSTEHGFLIPALNNDYNKITATNTADGPLKGGRLTSCYALFNGDKVGLGTLDGSMSGLFDIYKVAVPVYTDNDVSALSNFMSGVLKYNINTEQASSEEYCYTAYAKERTTAAEWKKLGSYCRNQDAFPINPNDKISFKGGDADADYTVSGSVHIPTGYGDGNAAFVVTVTSKSQQCWDGYMGTVKCNVSVEYPLSIPSEGATEVSDFTFNSQNWTPRPQIKVEVSKSATDGENSRDVIYQKENGKWKDSLSAITGGTYTDRVAFSDADKYDFYLQYLSTYYGKSGTTMGSTTCQANKPSSLVDAANDKYYIWIKGSGWCLANLDSNKVKNSVAMTVFTNSERYKLDKVVNGVGELVELMGELDYSNSDDFVDVDSSGGDEPGTGTDPGTGGGGSSDPCFTSSGSMGWIVCPVINWLGDTLKSLYSQMVEPLLVVKSELFNGGDNSATYQAWEIFRNIANVMFVILFLVVIFSQLTGVGIDNYGIKKILPKLIVAAVLINLSYIICQLAVDLSNIAGAGLNNLFTNQAGKLSGLSGDFTSGVWFKHVLNILLGVLIGGGVAGVVLTVVGEGLLSGLILPLLMGLIVAFVAVVFFFALLGMRQAGVVVLVVVAPVAFACYMLPNTKKIFDRWLKIFQGLLLLYPICGLLVGGSTLASAILVSNSKNFFIYMIGLLLMVVPFFFIPILLKSSFAAMGNIGAKISGWGSRLGKSVSGRADKGIRNSNAFKNSQELAAERRTRIRAGIGKDGKARKVSGFGKFLRGGDRNMARARAQYLKNQDARNREENLMGVGFAAATIGQEKRAERDELADYMTLINNETRNGEDDVALGEMYNDYMQNGNKAGAVAVARIAGRRKDTAAAFLKNYVTNDSLTSGYNDVQREILRSVSKEVSTGENSGMYRESTPLGFEFAAQMNRGTAGTNSYSEWLGKQDERGSFANVHRAMENYITDTKQLVGAKGGSLREIGDLMGRDEMVTDENGNTTIQRHNQQMDAADLARVSTLATQAIENRDKPGASWDSTKAEELCRISGKYDYNRQTGEITLRPEYANAGSVNGGAAEGENFNVREASATVNEGAASGAGVGGGNTEFNVRSMDDDTLLDLATSPGVPNNSNLRTAAEQEYRRRNPGYVGGGINSGNGGQSNAQRNNIPTNIGGSGGADSVSE